MADPLASIDDVQERLGVTFTGADADRVEALIRDASAKVRNYTGQTFTLEETTDRLKARNGRLTLPQRPVVEVATVQDTNAVDVDYTLTNDILWLNTTWSGLAPFDWEPRTTPLGYVDVTYTHGYETIPDDILAVVCQIVGRAYGVNSQTAGLTGETIAGYSYTMGSVGGAGAVGLLPEERAVLDAYRRIGGLATYAP